jgi:cell division protein FtsB
LLGEVAASTARQQADKKLLELMSDFRMDPGRKEKAAANQVDQLMKRNTALEEENAQLQKDVGDPRTKHQDIRVDEQKHRQASEEPFDF